MHGRLRLSGVDRIMSKSLHDQPLVLVADRESPAGSALCRALGKHGFRVEAVRNGTMACAAFVRHQPDVVILGLETPVRDGLEICTEIRRLPGGNDTSIVIVSEYHDAATVDQAYEAGATDFIAKPINLPIFCYRIRTILRASRDCHYLRKAKAQNRVLLDAIPDTFVVFSADDKVSDYLPGNFEHPFPEPRAGVRYLTDFLPDAVVAMWRKSQRLVSKSEQPVRIEFAVRRSAEVSHYYEARFVPYIDGATLALVSEITGRKMAEKRIRRLAFFDNLTGLPNRQSFRLQLGGLIDQADETGDKVAVLYIDLDNFKRINDTLGHTVGDGVIKAIAERLSGSIRDGRPGDRESGRPSSIARLGGDEFAYVISGFRDQNVLSSIAERFGENLRKPVRYDGHEFVITPSIGVSVYPDDADNVEDLLKHADVAMYQAKDAGRDSIRFYSDTLAIRSLQGLALENDLRRALEKDVLELHYQPKIGLKTGELVGAEALVRWRNEDGKYIPPSRFIPMAEKSGQIVPLGDWVLRTACKQARDWQRRYGQSTRIAVNISSQQFYQSNLQETVMKALFEAGAKPSLLQLELTESILMRDIEKTIATLEYLKNTGITLAMDDFGTGYSSLSYLRRFPIDALKIDRSFVMDLEEDGNGAAICAAIIAMSRQLGLTVTAEGVETRGQVDFLRSHDCDEIQGFLISKPVPAADFEARFLADATMPYRFESVK